MKVKVVSLLEIQIKIAFSKIANHSSVKLIKKNKPKKKIKEKSNKISYKCHTVEIIYLSVFLIRLNSSISRFIEVFSFFFFFIRTRTGLM